MVASNTENSAFSGVDVSNTTAVIGSPCGVCSHIEYVCGFVNFDSPDS